MFYSYNQYDVKVKLSHINTHFYSNFNDVAQCTFYFCSRYKNYKYVISEKKKVILQKSLRTSFLQLLKIFKKLKLNLPEVMF